MTNMKRKGKSSNHATKLCKGQRVKFPSY